MDYAADRSPLLRNEETEDEHDSSNDPYGYNGTKDVYPLITPSEPMDEYNLAYLIFYFLGMTTLLPWNFLITADSYWMFKLRNVSDSEIVNQNRTTMQAEFVAYVSIASTVPNTLFLILNTLLSHRVSLQVRMVGSLGSIIMLFITTTVLVKIDTDLWQEVFLGMTLSIVVLLNVASAVMGGSLFGIVGKFSPRYMSAVVSGQALGGIVAALAQITSLALGASPINSAFVYFMAANVILLVALVSYVVLSRMIFFQHHVNVNKPEPNPCIQDKPEEIAPRNIYYTHIFKKIWVYGFVVWLTFVVTLSAFPSVTVLVSSMDKGNGHVWNDVYFVPVIGFLLFSMFDYTGRITAGHLQRPKRTAWLLAVLGVFRCALVPLVMLCNAHPRQHLPVIIDSDLDYILLVICLAFSNGYLNNIAMICVPQVVDSHEQETASHMMAAFIGIGLACGSVMGLFMVKLL